jgi:nickel transport system substrate-binding protein
LDPHTYRPNEFFANNWVYEGLVSYAAGGVIEPSLATSWTVADHSGGGQQFTFTLRQNVKFHDGADWNCAVAKLNFDHVLAAPLTTGDWHGWYDLPKKITSWSCTSTYVFTLVTSSKYYPLLQELTYIRPLRMLSPNKFVNGLTTNPTTHNSCHAGWGSITGNGQTITCAGIIAPSGTGPFVYAGTAYNGDVMFNKNTQHWRAAPQVDLVVKKYANSAEVMAALVNGSLDAVMGAGVLQPADLRTVQTQHTSTFQVFLGPSIQNRVIIMNANRAPTNDLNFRKTVMHAVNKASIIDKELSGFAKAVDSLFPKDAPYCDVDLTPRWDYDSEKARLLRCPAPAPTVVASSSSSDDDDDGIKLVIVIVIIVAVVILALVLAVVLFIYGKKQGVLQQKLLQQQQNKGNNPYQVGNTDDAVGKPAATDEV